jgi:predicted nucleic acid-binding protein
VKLLADTSGLVALFRKHDAHHAVAERWLRSAPEARFLMTDLVFSETMTRLAAGDGPDRAVAAADKLLASARYTLIFVDEPIVRGALEKMTKLADKKLSFADCASFEVMERLALDGAFTFDRDFRDCGYRMLPG